MLNHGEEKGPRTDQDQRQIKIKTALSTYIHI